MKLTLVLVGVLAWGQSAGTFVSTGKMNVGRSGYSATLLRDGRVLIAGGCPTDCQLPYLASAEIYDPSTGTFTLTGSMTRGRSGHTATLLQDGRVLVANGVWDPTLASAEIYDPATGRFSLTGNLTVQTNALGVAAALLKDGRVLFVTTVPSGEPAFAGQGIVEVYDPGTGRFSPAGTVPMVYPTATPLADGRVLLVGVTTDWGDNIAMIYDPATGKFSLTGRQEPHSIFSGQFGGVATYYPVTALLANGSVLLAGGYDWWGNSEAVGERSSVEIYDPSTGTFRDIPADGVMTPTVTTLPGGRVVIGGNRTIQTTGAGSVGSNPAAQLYDPLSGAFRVLSPVMQSWGSTATLLLDGSVLIAGSISANAEAWLLVPAPWAVSAASLSAPVAPESLVSVFGAHLAAESAAADPQSPTASLGGVRVRVRDSAGAGAFARLFYVSPSQINLELPAGTPAGNVNLDILNGSDTLSVNAEVRGVAPGIFTFPGNQAAGYAVRVEADGGQTVLPAGKAIVLDDRPVYLALFGTGIRGRSSLATVRCTIGKTSLPVTYAGPQGGVLGLDQVNVLLTPSLKGNADGRLVLTVDGFAANTVLVDIR